MKLKSIRRISNAWILTEQTMFGARESAVSLKELKRIVNEIEEDETMEYCIKCDDVTYHSDGKCDICGTKIEEDDDE